MNVSKNEERRSKMLQRLSCAFGVSGDEKEVMDTLEQLFPRGYESNKDRFGNRIFSKTGTNKRPKILVTAHTDEVGFMVQAVHPNGFLSFVPIGVWSPLSVVGMPVQVKGSRGLVDGVIGSVPPHHRKANQESLLPGWEEMWIDVGARNEEEIRGSLGIRLGDRVQPYPQFQILSEGRVLMSKAWDDRVGCGLLVELFQKLAYENHPNGLIGLATVQEELGARGAQVVAGRLEADVALILEGAPADDFPSSTSWQAQAVMGKGVQIRSFDPSMQGNTALCGFLVEIAEKENIQHQLAVRRSGGTDGGPLHQAGIGIPTVVLAVPVRYAHNGVGLIALEDYEACLHLLVSAVQGITKKEVSSFLP